MNRSVGDFDSCASSTRRTTRAMVLSEAEAVTRTRRTLPPLIVPANTGSPTTLRLGTLSPVTGASSRSPAPSMISPSAGTRSPGRTRMTAPTATVSAATSVVTPSTSTKAVLGTRAASPWMLLRARPAATPSSISPTRNSKTTAAASSAAPMKTAPTAAMVISISMEKGVPWRAAEKARDAIGINPTARAARKAYRSREGNSVPSP